jgi:calcineurin-like phosphoesterase family protein
MNIWFTSDTHFNHANVIGHSYRPFADLSEMTEAMIVNWNEVVAPSDTIYHLGDFALSWGKKHKEVIDQILARLNGQKWLITGNHDREEVTKNTRWTKVLNYHEIKIDLGGEHKQRVVMCHYAMRVWNQMHRGAWMLHGHSHGNITDVGGKALDVGVDVHNYRPISLEFISSFMAGREIVECDHHSVDE